MSYHSGKLLVKLYISHVLLSTQNWVQGLWRCEAGKDDPSQVPVLAAGWEKQPGDQLQCHFQGAGATADCWHQGPGETADTQSVQWALHGLHQTGETPPFWSCNMVSTQWSCLLNCLNAVKFLPCSSNCITWLRHLSSGILFPLSDILRLTGIVFLALNRKNLEPQHQARASQWRNPKISRVLHRGAPRRPPQRTSPRTGRRWGTRRKVKRWTTNWLRQKSKNHLALLLLSFLICGGKTNTEAAKLIKVCIFTLISPSFPFLSMSSSLTLTLTVSPLCTTMNNMLGFRHDIPVLLPSHVMLDRPSEEWVGASSASAIWCYPPPPLCSLPSRGCYSYQLPG